VVVNSQPVKAEMSVATPKAQAKDPIQLDIILVCRKAAPGCKRVPVENSVSAARAKVERLRLSGFELSRNDCKVVFYGQLLTSISRETDVKTVLAAADGELLPAVIVGAEADRSRSLQTLPAIDGSGLD
jgi:hypothetical protein